MWLHTGEEDPTIIAYTRLWSEAMLFNSWIFVVFGLTTFIFYYLPIFRKVQVYLLIGASFFFYAWENPWLLSLLIFSITINSLTSYQVTYANSNRLTWATSGVVVNLLVLGFFKYTGLLSGHLIDLPLPIGISFYTFEGISLLMDALSCKESDPSFVEASRIKHLANTAFFVAFFPHLIAGPILKARSLYPQISSKYFKDIVWCRASRSLITGYFLKLVVADNLKDYTFWLSYPYYKSLSTSTGLTLLFGYSMQIFADFAGYSLIAIGLAALFGYTLPANFNFPYISRSLSEFWRRWHISLSTWLRDYLYFPLGGNRKGNIRTYLNLMIVMILGGLWHGAAWSYAIWGLYHGLGLAIERFITKRRPGDGNLFSALGVFLFVSFGWLLFKFPQFDQAIGFAKIMLINIRGGMNLGLILPTLLFSLPVIIYHFLNIESLAKLGKNFEGLIPILRDATLGFLVFLIVLNSGYSNGFIYFQF
jgi:alginate O-acetyltransferase complex protein AlgI